MKLLSCVFLMLALVLAASAADVTGKWSGTFTPVGPDGQAAGNSNSAYIILKQSGTTVTGSGGPDENEQWPVEKGKIEGNKITGQVTSPDGAVYALTMTVDGDSMKGEVVVSQGGETQSGKIELKRVN